MNPVVVKELRQSVRSWTVIGMLLLFLIVMFLTLVFAGPWMVEIMTDYMRRLFESIPQIVG